MGSNPYNYFPEKTIINAPSSVPLKSLNLITEQSKNNILKIINQKKEVGTGFFCLIPLPDKLHPLPTLITNNHVLKESDIEIGKTIKFSSEEKEYQIEIDNHRRCYTNKEEYDTTIIEMKLEDGINLNKFLEIDEDIFDTDAKEIFSKKSVYIMHYPHGNQNEISFGKIKAISLDNINIEHLCNTSEGSSGGPILNMINYKVIGIHKGAEKNKNWNLGTLLQLPIKKFNEEFCNKEENKNSKNENNLNNENCDIIRNNANDKNADNKRYKERNNESNNFEVNKPPDNEFSEFSLFNTDIQEDINSVDKNNKEKEKLPENKNIQMNYSSGNIKEDNPNNEGNNNNINAQSIISNNYISNSQNQNIQNDKEINNNLINNSSHLVIDNNINNPNSEIIADENIADEITIIYSKTNVKSNNLLDNLKFKIASVETFSQNKLFGEKFVKNNINKCKIIIDGREYKLASYINEVYNEYIYFLELKLKGVSKITDMSNMFCGCISLTAVPDIDKLDTKNVISLSNIFSGCESLQSLPDISKWNTSKVIKMGHIFQKCSLLTSLPDISKWDTSKAIDMTYIFSYCEKLLSLPDISKWDTSKAISFCCMFNDCRSLRVLPDISKWNTINVKDMGFMFDSCENLISLPDISRWNTRNLEDTRYMFHNCSSLQSLPDLTKWNTNNLKEVNNMFAGCRSNLNVPQRFKGCLIF